MSSISPKSPSSWGTCSYEENREDEEERDPFDGREEGANFEKKNWSNKSKVQGLILP